MYFRFFQLLTHFLSIFHVHKSDDVRFRNELLSLSILFSSGPSVLFFPPAEKARISDRQTRKATFVTKSSSNGGHFLFQTMHDRVISASVLRCGWVRVREALQPVVRSRFLPKRKERYRLLYVFSVPSRNSGNLFTGKTLHRSCFACSSVHCGRNKEE